MAGIVGLLLCWSSYHLRGHLSFLATIRLCSLLLDPLVLTLGNIQCFDSLRHTWNVFTMILPLWGARAFTLNTFSNCGCCGSSGGSFWDCRGLFIQKEWNCIKVSRRPYQQSGEDWEWTVTAKHNTYSYFGCGCDHAGLYRCRNATLQRWVHPLGLKYNQYHINQYHSQ